MQLSSFFALLVGYCAGSFAGRLAGSLALAASAARGSLLEVGFIDGFDVFHIENSFKQALNITLQ
jgi:hypothetical protein